MSIKLSELISKFAKRSIEYADETINLEIFTQKVTPAYRANWQQQVEKDPSRESRCQLIADMVQSWDVQGDNDQPQPVTYDFLQLCPEGFLNLLVEQVEDVLFPKDPTNASSSPSGSQPTTTPQES